MLSRLHLRLGIAGGFAILSVLLLTAVTFLRVNDPYPVATARGLFFDSLQRLSPRDYPNLPVRVVDIDDASLAEIGQWPWPRSILAEMTERLFEMGAATVVFDVLFAEPDRYSLDRVLEDPVLRGALNTALQSVPREARDNDKRFSDALRYGPTVLGIAAAHRNGGVESYDKAGFVELGAGPRAGLVPIDGSTSIVAGLKASAAGLGGINVSPLQQGGVVRRVPIAWKTPEGILPGLSIEALRVALGETTYFLVGSPDIDGVVQSLEVGGYAIPTTDEGQIWVHYRHDDPRLYVPAAQVLRDAPTPEVFDAINGNIVLVGTSAAGLLDIRTTALGENVPGVSIHAQIIEQILTDRFLYRSDFVAGLEVLVFLLLGAVVTVVMARYGPTITFATGGVCGVIVVLGSWYAFTRAGVLFDATYPLFGGAANFALLLIYQLVVVDREKRMIRRSFAHYVAPSVLSDIESKDYALELGGENREVTVMFSDIRDFTPLSEQLEPQALVGVLNTLFSDLSAAILKEQGTIDKYIGDAIMAFWNAPIERPEHELHACRAALMMRGALEAFNDAQSAEYGHRIDIGIGCATGIACVGNIGSAQRFNYSVIGDTVNVAARIESATKALGFDIVVAEHTADAAGALALLYAGSVTMKGKSEPIALYAVVGDEAVARSPEFAELREAHAALLAAIVSHRTERLDALVLACKAQGDRVLPRLGHFYDVIPTRLDDFDGDHMVRNGHGPLKTPEPA